MIAMPSAGAGGGVDFGASAQRFLQTDNVEITLTNNTDHSIELFSGGIYSLRTGEKLVSLEPEDARLQSGTAHSWTWITQDRVGRFVARFRTSEGPVSDQFDK